ncbi:ATP synthase subunit C [Peptoniphilus raoultii]|uniref:ATP synthase subunit C n=1 Tax=Peptoniphilus raoultii TaxID=1776387 RepID=UPI0008DAD4EF|nr:ATP synthase subunit C [Peptoniphilus raoultii]
MEKLMILSILALIAIFGSTGYFMLSKTKKSQKFMRAFLRLNLLIFIPVIVFGVITLVPQMASAAENAPQGGNGLGFLAAGLSTGLASIGAGLAVSQVGAAAIGAISEDETILGKTMIYLGLAEGIAIYGLIISIMILGRL